MKNQEKHGFALKNVNEYEENAQNTKVLTRPSWLLDKWRQKKMPINRKGWEEEDKEEEKEK